MKPIRTVVLSLVMLVAGASAAMAGGIPKLKTIEKRGSVSERLPGTGLRVRAPIGTRLQKSMGGMTGTFKPYDGKARMNRKGDGIIIHLDSGRYFDPGANRVFEVKARPAIQPRPWTK